MPNLISNFRKREIETALPIAYKLIDDAMKLAVIENGHPSTWEYDKSKDLAEKYFIPYVRVAKKCGQGNSTNVGTGCFKNDKSNKNGIWLQLNGEQDEQGGYTYNWYYTMILKNGMHVGIWGGRKNDGVSQQKISFVVDVNGKKGPTILGHDVFVFILHTPTNELVAGGQNRYSSFLGCAAGKNGYNCAEVIQKNGWKIPDDYPVKKW